jgi:hypothetical protein
MRGKTTSERHRNEGTQQRPETQASPVLPVRQNGQNPRPSERFQNQQTSGSECTVVGQDHRNTDVRRKPHPSRIIACVPSCSALPACLCVCLCVPLSRHRGETLLLGCAAEEARRSRRAATPRGGRTGTRETGRERTETVRTEGGDGFPAPRIVLARCRPPR